MKPRLWTSLLVLFVLVVLAAAGQEFLPGPGRLAPRWEFLISLVIYYGMRREKQMAMTAAVWCGLLTEGFDSLPPGTALLLFIGIGFLCGRTLRGQMSDSLLSCALAGGFLVPAWCLAQYVLLRMSGACGPLPALYVLARVLVAVPLGALTAGVTALAAHRLDWISANVDLENEYDSDELSA